MDAVLAVLADVVRELAIPLQPVMPGAVARLLDFLARAGRSGIWDRTTGSRPAPDFPRRSASFPQLRRGGAGPVNQGRDWSWDSPGS